MLLPKVEIKKIFYATDLSESARHAFAYAVSLANLYRARMVIFHALIETSDLAGTYIGKDQWAEIKRRHLEGTRAALIGKKRENLAIQEALQKFVEKARQQGEDPAFMTDEIIVRKGSPADNILEVAEAQQCDLIVMGSHGHGGLVGAVMGSTAQRVLRRSKIPVLVVRLPEEA